MDKTDKRYKNYIDILTEELIPAMGCTEPIAIAYAAAKAREVLGEIPEKIVVEASGSIIKNVKSVVVPNTGGLKGIAAAAAAGVIAGDASKELEVIASATKEQIAALPDYISNTDIKTEFLKSDAVFDMIVTVIKGGNNAKVRITDHHTDIVYIEKNGETVFKSEAKKADGEAKADRSELSVEAIWDFANTCNLDDVKDILKRQIEYNTAISDEGLRNRYGASIGQVLRACNEDTTATRAKSAAAAGSDARMNGCEMPVIINSGSGNQGITVSVPVVVFGRELGKTEDEIYRALIMSNLIAIHQKTRIGTLSAFCGAVSAGAAAGFAIAYLKGSDYNGCVQTLGNALAVASGMLCDGAKASCAAKIAQSIDTALLGYNIYVTGEEFAAGDGILNHDIEEIIKNVGDVAHDGMRETNEEIIKIMIK